MQRLLDRSGVSMGPISLSFDSDSVADEYLTDKELIEMVRQERKTYKSIHSMTTEEWRAKFEKDGAIDLWVEEEFNAGSRLVVCNHRSQQCKHV
jgi:ferredoxin